MSNSKRHRFVIVLSTSWGSYPDERWQVDLFYLKILSRSFYCIILMDEYSRAIVHGDILRDMQGDTVS